MAAAGVKIYEIDCFHCRCDLACGLLPNVDILALLAWSPLPEVCMRVLRAFSSPWLPAMSLLMAGAAAQASDAIGHPAPFGSANAPSSAKTPTLANAAAATAATAHLS